MVKLVIDITFQNVLEGHQVLAEALIWRTERGLESYLNKDNY